jgi:hypothetical protein
MAMNLDEFREYAEDWDVLSSFFPNGWQEKAKHFGALRRCRKFADPKALMRTLLIHFVDGCSLRETAARASEGNLASISDVALLKRLKACGEWFRWMAAGLMKDWVTKQPSVIFGEDLCIRVIDATTVQEPGSTGSTWRIHYSIELPSLRCNEVYVTSPKVGESFKNFSVNPGDFFVADRGYAHRAAILHVVNEGGNVLVRLNLNNIPLLNEDGSRFALLEHLRTLTGNQLGDWNVFTNAEDTLISGRVCAIKKSKEATEKAQRKVIAESRKKGHKPQPETIEAAGYIFVFTTDRKLTTTAVLEMYRGRWQIELVFKRLKSIMGLGHLKKSDLEGAKAWIHGKLFVAFLIEALIRAGENFSPWGYPICKDSGQGKMFMEGAFIDASPC